MSPPLLPAPKPDASNRLARIVMGTLVVVLGGPALLVVLVPFMAYGFIFFLAADVGLAALAFWGLRRLLALSPSSTATVEGRLRWRSAIVGSLAGVTVYGVAAALLAEWTLPNKGAPWGSFARFMDHALDLFLLCSVDLFLVAALALGFAHGFYAGWRSAVVFPNRIPPPLPAARRWRMSPRQRQLVFTVFWAPLIAALYLLCLASVLKVVWLFSPHPRPNHNFRADTEIQHTAPWIGGGTVLLVLMATLLWRIWREGLLPFDLMHSARVRRQATRIRDALLGRCRLRKLCGRRVPETAVGE